MDSGPSPLNAVDAMRYKLYVVSMELEEILSLPDGPRRTTALAAWVQDLYRDQETLPVLVGGAAVEVLTGGAYTTGDLDFVGIVPASVRRRLEAVGFQKHGRHWIHEEGQIFLEFPGETLTPGETATQHRAFGYDVVVVSVEDLLVDRLGAWAYWESGVDGANAFLLYRICRNEIDQKRLTRRAREAGFEQALDALRAFDHAWADRDPQAQDLETWANTGPSERDS